MHKRFPSYLLTIEYRNEELDFKKTIKLIQGDNVSKIAKTIRSHVIYKIRINDDHTMKVKARIAPQGPKDKEKDDLKTGCATFLKTSLWDTLYESL